MSETTPEDFPTQTPNGNYELGAFVTSVTAAAVHLKEFRAQHPASQSTETEKVGLPDPTLPHAS